MQFVDQSVQLLRQASGKANLFEFIERAGRTCYLSQDKITEGSAEKFVQKLISNGHTSVLEHGTIYLQAPYLENTELLAFYGSNPYSKVGFFNYFYTSNLLISTNYRVIVENHREADLKWIQDHAPLERLERYSFKIICPISISRELCRHRKFSFSEQSTRYVDFSKDKFNNQLTFIKPIWYDKLDTDGKRIIFEQSLQKAEETYMNMRSYASPQEAREILPLCTKTEIVMTGFLEDWKHFLKLRQSPAAHPQMRELANNIDTILDTIHGPSGSK